MERHGRLDDLLSEVLAQPIRGWDFRWLRERGGYDETPVPWDYRRLVLELSQGSPDLLDLGTGGGELLATLAPHPRRTVATESYAPNVPVAASRLGPLGIDVVRTSAAADNAQSASSPTHGALPFRDDAFHLITDRNEAFVATEVARVLVAGGYFLTEQTGNSARPAFGRLLGLPRPTFPSPPWHLRVAAEQLRRAGLRAERSGEARTETLFYDVASLVGYLRAVPWEAPGFSVDRCRPRLEELHATVSRVEPIRIPRTAFWLVARK